MLGTALDEADDLVAWGEAVGVAPATRAARQPDAPARELEGQRIPALAPPALGHPPALEDHVLAAELGETVAEREPGLAAADDDGLVRLAHAGIAAGGVSMVKTVAGARGATGRPPASRRPPRRPCQSGRPLILGIRFLIFEIVCVVT